RSVPDRLLDHRPRAAVLALGRPYPLYFVRDRLPADPAHGPRLGFLPRAGGTAGQHDLRAALLAGRGNRRLLALAGRQHRPLFDAAFVGPDDAVDQRALDRDGAVLLTRRVADRVRERPVGQPAALHHVGG